MKTLILLLAAFLFFLNGFGQNLSGNINTYYEVTNLNQSQAKVTLSNASGINVNDSLIILQMQGALINSSVIDTVNGHVTDYNGAGSWEVVEVCEVNGNTLIFKKEFLNQYDEDGNVQLIKIDVLNNAVINGTVSCQAWNGSTGGIVFIYNVGVLTFNANIDVSGKGFRGGADFKSTLPCTFTTSVDQYDYDSGTGQSGEKGEGVSNFTNQTCGRGPTGNGGGGGNDHNTGGGGGSNLSPGGMGGENQDPGVFNCHGYYPGLNGRALSSGGEKIFLGGGGGAGHSNNIGTSNGVNGGAMVIIISDDIAGNNHSILNFGMNAPTSSGDGAGGGGAGGSVFFHASTFSSPLTIDVHGGEGGDMNAAIAANMDRCFGPGGGGSGGMVRYSENTLPSNHTHLINGGSPGIVVASTAPCNGESIEATGGSNGVLQTDGQIPRGIICNDDCISSLQVHLGPDLLLCDQTSTSLDANVNNVNYLWSTNETTEQISVTANGDYWVEVDNNFCKDYDTVNVYNLNSPIYPSPVTFGVCESTATLDAGTPGLEFRWNTGDTTQTITVSDPGMYYVDMYFEHCGFRAFFHVFNCIQPPNAITPNGDGDNDQWFIEYILDYPENRVEIYNRRGQIVFEKDSYANEFSGEGLPDGVYYYKIDLRNGMEIINGTITIIRER